MHRATVGSYEGGGSYERGPPEGTRARHFIKSLRFTPIWGMSPEDMPHVRVDMSDFTPWMRGGVGSVQRIIGASFCERVLNEAEGYVRRSGWGHCPVLDGTQPRVQGYLTYTTLHPSRTLPQAYA